MKPVLAMNGKAPLELNLNSMLEDVGGFYLTAFSTALSTALSSAHSSHAEVWPDVPRIGPAF